MYLFIRNLFRHKTSPISLEERPQLGAHAAAFFQHTISVGAYKASISRKDGSNVFSIVRASSPSIPFFLFFSMAGAPQPFCLRLPALGIRNAFVAQMINALRGL